MFEPRSPASGRLGLKHVLRDFREMRTADLTMLSFAFFALVKGRDRVEAK